MELTAHARTATGEHATLRVESVHGTDDPGYVLVAGAWCGWAPRTCWAARTCGPGPGPTVTASDYRLALELRSRLRALTLVNNGGPVEEAELTGLRRALDRLPLVVDPTPDGSTGPALRPHRLAPATSALSRLAAGSAAARAAGLWHRLRRCPADDCAWAFWDSSAKGTRRWCTMRVCGNRAKARSYAGRRRAPDPVR